MNALEPKTIVIAPVGGVGPQLPEAVARGIERVFRTASRIEPIFSDLSFAFDAGRRQYHSTAILQVVERSAPANVFKVLALVQVDLFIPILTYVYGEAQLGGKACVLSTSRLAHGAGPREGPDSLLARTVKEALHELGHTFGLRHCPDPACLMHYCRSEADVDRKSNELCRYCRVMLDDELRKPAASEWINR